MISLCPNKSNIIFDLVYITWRITWVYDL